ncbi:MAG: hypothetical protein NTX16_11260 [Actinobacteria bacterium]|nr:hypothetical protein [Actinomycetota bacterium]
MDLLEHEGKGLFAGAGLRVLLSRVAMTPAKARVAAVELGLPVTEQGRAVRARGWAAGTER